MRTKQKIYTAIGLIMIFGFGFLPSILGLPRLGMQIIGIFSGTIWLFVMVDTTWTAFLPIIALSLFQIYPYTEVLKMSIGSWVFAFVLATQMLCYTLSKCGVLKRIAVNMISIPVLHTHPWMLIGGMMMLPIIIGSFTSVIPTFLVCTSICMEILEQAGFKKGDRTAEVLMMGILTFTCAAEGMSPIAHTVPILALSLYSESASGIGTEISFIEYFLTNACFVCVIFLVFFLLAKYLYKIDLKKFEDIDMGTLKKTLGPVSKSEILTLLVFLFVVILWIAPGIVNNPFLNRLGVTIPAMCGVVLLCMIHVDGKELMNFNDCIKNGIAWRGQIMICVSVMMGNVLMLPEAGIKEFLLQILGTVVEQVPPFIIILIIVGSVSAMTNFMSDSVTVTVVYSVVMPLIMTGTIQAISAEAFTVLLGFTASLAFATPAACANAAIQSGNGWVRRKEQFKIGATLSLISTIIISLMAVPVSNFFL